MANQPSDRYIPILLGLDYKHVMGYATILEEGDKLTISIVADGDGAKNLAAVLNAEEPMAISFVPIPVQPRSTHPKENN